MKTPYLDQLINDLKFLDRTHALSSKGFDSLKEYNSIKQTLEELERVKKERDELIQIILDYGSPWLRDQMRRILRETKN